MPENNTYTISETYELPSKGLIYEKPINAKLELRSMTTREELRRLSPSASPLKTLADIIEDCIINKPAIHVYDMAMGDYEYLLHKLRVVTYGANYSITTTCPECGETIESVANLDELEVKEFDPIEFEKLRTFDLPVSKHTITLKLQTPHSLDLVETKAKEMKRKAKGTPINFDTYAQLLMSIDTVDGNILNSTDMEFFINDLSARDMNKILTRSEKFNTYIGLDNKLSLTCPICGEIIQTSFRFGPEFFRPSDDE